MTLFKILIYGYIIWHFFNKDLSTCVELSKVHSHSLFIKGTTASLWKWNRQKLGKKISGSCSSWYNCIIFLLSGQANQNFLFKMELCYRLVLFSHVLLIKFEFFCLNFTIGPLSLGACSNCHPSHPIVIPLEG